MSLEDQIRAEMEQQAAQEHLQPHCPVEGDVDAAFGHFEATQKFGRGSSPVKQHGDIKKAKKAAKAEGRRSNRITGHNYNQNTPKNAYVGVKERHRNQRKMESQGG